ncbi:hypothetical protein [Deinococcus sp. 23YEL01]|uniref:hypothetical protein n=1 Tax=Deinococcus sp. 23YEL01 TaxID=2745871 RepID=UPI001E43B6BE|nr:hypothetical protein [Deinococcus sp. 23YEL01]
MASLSWKIKEILDEEGVSAYSLVKVCKYKLSANTVYGICRGDQKVISLRTLGIILDGLEMLLDRRISIDEIFQRSNDVENHRSSEENY